MAGPCSVLRWTLSGFEWVRGGHLFWTSSVSASPKKPLIDSLSVLWWTARGSFVVEGIAIIGDGLGG